MKIARIIGLAAIAAMALMASAGVGTALAIDTTLCKTSTDSPYCKEGDSYPAGTTLQAATPGKFKIVNEVINVRCKSTLEGKTSAKAGTPLALGISAWTLSECTFGCKVSFVTLPTSGSLSWSNGTEGTLALRVGASQPQLNVNCFGIMNCTWNFPDMTFKGGNPGQLVVPETKLVLVKGDENCPKEAKFESSTSTFTVNSPNPAYVGQVIAEEAETRFCKAQEKTCSGANTYPFGTAFNAEAPALKIENPIWNVNCGKTTMSAKTGAVGANPLPLGPIVFSTTKCTGAWGVSGCSLTATNSPTGWVEAEGLGSFFGKFWFELYVDLQCAPGVHFLYYFPPLTTLTGGDAKVPPAFGYLYNELSLVKNYEGCTGQDKLSASFTVTTPQPLFVT